MSVSASSQAVAEKRTLSTLLGVFTAALTLYTQGHLLDGDENKQDRQDNIKTTQ